uniref:E3 ubiquitin-protein ligase TRIM39-like n=1 Tax=Oncorhynchus tshawytscha TaxID=74940 RepID=A0A8C8CPP2_ONCTS
MLNFALSLDMASSSSLLSEEQFLCSICLDVFTEPVTTSCGHNFCMACITKYWDSRDLYQCPLCKETLYRQPELRVNTTLREVVENFKKMRGRGKDESPPKPGKSLFCRTDQTCVCQFCTEADHKTHDIVSIEEEQKCRRSQTAYRSSLLWCAQLKKSQVELVKVIEERQKAVERQVEGLIKDLEQEITELKRRSTDLKQLSHTEDHLHLLQNYPSLVYKHPPTKNMSEISVHSALCVGTVRRAVSQLEETLNKEMEKLPEVKLKRIQQYAVDVTLDPDTAHHKLILSEDGKQVRHGDMELNLPDIPKRFDQHCIVLGKDGFSSGKFYYEVIVKGKTRWTLGVARESIDRKGQITLTPEDGLCVVYRRNVNVYKASNSPPVLLSLRKNPQKVGVFVDYEEGLISFYDVEARSHIYSYTGYTFTEKLFPFFGPSEKDENSAPLIISHVNHTG